MVQWHLALTHFFNKPALKKLTGFCISQHIGGPKCPCWVQALTTKGSCRCWDTLSPMTHCLLSSRDAEFCKARSQASVYWLCPDFVASLCIPSKLMTSFLPTPASFSHSHHVLTPCLLSLPGWSLPPHHSTVIASLYWCMKYHIMLLHMVSIKGFQLFFRNTMWNISLNWAISLLWL